MSVVLEHASPIDEDAVFGARRLYAIAPQEVRHVVSVRCLLELLVDGFVLLAPHGE